MKILIINCGSSSLKYQVFEMPGKKAIAKGLVEKIGLAKGAIIHSLEDGSQIKQNTKINNHESALELALEKLVDKNKGVLKTLEEIGAIGHRIVHGGEEFSHSVLIDSRVIEVLKRNIELAPLHNPANIMGIEACQKILPKKPQVGVFDTAFHSTIPDYAYLYAIPYQYYEKYKIRKYGFHGISHQYVSQRAAEILQKPLNELKIISCHLGNGSSITAIKNGVSIETSMGFTPLEGLIMGTRPGELDPFVVPFLMEKEGWNKNEINDFLNKRSGVLGISGLSSDFRDLEEEAKNGHQGAILALQKFIYVAQKYIGSYYAILNGLDSLIFTAGIGENSDFVRAGICQGLEALGIKINIDKNIVRGQEADISLDSSKIKVLVIPTNEEYMIAKDTYKIIKN